MAQRYPDWRDIVDAAGDGLAARTRAFRRALWGEACVAVGREIAAVALAVVSTKPREHFTRGAGGYFAAMIKRAKTGELHLDRSLWKLRRERLDRIERELSAELSRRAALMRSAGARLHAERLRRAFCCLLCPARCNKPSRHARGHQGAFAA